MPGFSERELDILEDMERRYETDLDYSKVADLVNSPEFDPYDLQISVFKNPSAARSAPREYWAASTVEIHRHHKKAQEAGEGEKARKLLQMLNVTMAGSEASAGLQIIKDLDEFWRFKPTVEALLDLDDQQLQAVSSVMQSLKNSDHSDIINRNKARMIERYQQWDEADLSTENINLGREIYEECVKISERGFPLLLAMKRALDGEEPDLEDLQRIRASRVRDELTDEEEEPNSVYFDLIVGRFDSALRNGISHNDIITDPGESVVRIPNEGIEYGYEEFNKIVRKNIANGTFVSGTFQSLVLWHAGTQGSDIREERPDWIFGERSMPENLQEEIDKLDLDQASF